jgi:hypothetical protein
MFQSANIKVLRVIMGGSVRNAAQSTSLIEGAKVPHFQEQQSQQWILL